MFLFKFSYDLEIGSITRETIGYPIYLLRNRWISDREKDLYIFPITNQTCHLSREVGLLKFYEDNSFKTKWCIFPVDPSLGSC